MGSKIGQIHSISHVLGYDYMFFSKIIYDIDIWLPKYFGLYADILQPTPFYLMLFIVSCYLNFLRKLTMKLLPKALQKYFS